MSGWRDRVDQLLYDGETVDETVEFDATSVVVTSHRVLAFAPEDEGANFEQVERPNVAGVDTSARAKASLLERGLKYGLVGALLVLAGHFIDLEGIVGGVDLQSQSTSQLGIGGVLGPLQGMMNLLAQLDQLLQTFGALALALAVALFGVYWYTRDETVVIEVAGDGNIHVPRPADTEPTVDRLEDAITPESSDAGDQSPEPSGDPLGEA